jgi:hypothetical protein
MTTTTTTTSIVNTPAPNKCPDPDVVFNRTRKQSHTYGLHTENETFFVYEMLSSTNTSLRKIHFLTINVTTSD